MAEEKTSYSIEIRYDQENVRGDEIEALAQELIKRGHDVHVKRHTPRGSLVEDLTRSAKDLVGLAENVYNAAESGYQKIRETVFGPTEKTGKPESNTSTGFDEIGPGTGSGAPMAETGKRAIVVTSPECLGDDAMGATRIGLMAKTSLDRTWQPSTLNAMVIPHPAFRPYLESIHWNPAYVFEGGYLTLDADKPTLKHEDAIKRFNLSSEAGPIIVIMASGFPFDQLQNLVIQFSLLKMPSQLFFCHGGDNAKAEQLRALAQRFGVNARMFGRVQGLPDYLSMADIVVADMQDKSTINLIENVGVPSVLVQSGQAISAAASFLAHEKSAILAPQILKLSSVIVQPMTDENLRRELRAAAESISTKGSVVLCADGIEAALANRSTSNSPDSKAITTNDGFETIGQVPSMAPGKDFLTPQLQPVETPQAAPVQTMQPAMPIQPAMPLQPAMPVQPGMPAQPPFMPAPGIYPPPMAPTPGILQPQQPSILMPNLTGLSRKELETQYTSLIKLEKSIDKALNSASEDVRTWEFRLDLARQNNRDDLVASAIGRLDMAKQQEMALLRQKDEIVQQKIIFKQSAQAMRRQAPLQKKNNSNDIDDDFDISRVTEEDLFGPSDEDKKLDKEFADLQRNSALNDLKSRLGK